MFSPRRAGSPRRSTGHRRSGMAAVIAMLYMVLFAALAIGFYAQTTMSAQVGYNEQRMLASRTAAESGMEWMRYQLLQVQIPPLTPDAQILELVYKDLTNRLEMTGNLGSNLVYMNPGATQIEVPEGSKNFITLIANGPRFRIVIRQKGRDLVVTSIGSPSETRNTRSAVELTFRPTQETGTYYDYGMVSRGGVSINPSGTIVQGSPTSYANILSTGSVTIGAATNTTTTGIAGEITVIEGTIPTLLGPVSVDGETNPALILAKENDHVNYIPAESVPELPVADTSIFKPWAKNPYVAGKAVYDNVIIPPNTNPKIDGPTKVRGVVWVQQPNVVTFAGNVELQCVIVGENTYAGTLATNAIKFSGTGGVKLPLSALPYEPQFEGLHALTGTFLLAPGFDVQFAGNFGGVTGDVAAARISFAGNTTASVTGSLMTLGPYPLSVSGSVSLTLKPNPNSLHSGIRHTEAFYALPSTWREINSP